MSGFYAATGDVVRPLTQPPVRYRRNNHPAPRWERLRDPPADVLSQAKTLSRPCPLVKRRGIQESVKFCEFERLVMHGLGSLGHIAPKSWNP